ncbi:MAG TPA: diguanylate cyclase [Solirubrobacteraceae bacterium]|nr:diguanylate cyclase [Solirubrobacteraceae bacterium]
MSFRNRLTLFFLAIVVVPMVSVGVLVFVLIADNETGKTDARVAEAQAAARGVYREAVNEADTALRRVAADQGLAAALRARDTAAAQRRAAALMTTFNLRRLRTTAANGQTLADVGERSAIAPARTQLLARGGSPVGELEVSTTTARTYADRIREVTTLDAVLRQGGLPLASTGKTPARPLPGVGTVSVGGTDYRVASFNAPGFGTAPVRVSVLYDNSRAASAVSRSRLIVGAVLVGFLLLASLFAIAVSRALQGQIQRFLEAARRLGGGDFSTVVPTEGHDEFAALGDEFNKMSRQLETRLEELRQERARLQGSIRRIGETFASNLDREGLLEIVVDTALDALAADCGRASVRDPDGRLQQRVARGDVAGFAEAVQAAEASALASRREEQATIEGSSALAMPLTEAESPDAVIGLVSVARASRPFSDAERELFSYLGRQASVSLENVDLHELVARQAMTDDLTGLFNHRRFQEVVDTEVGRSKRFDQGLGMLMLDLDDFKEINDTYGHQQGDLVLREVARVLEDTSREIDEPARYGGEELAVALPQTDLDGAFNLAERVREGIEALEIPRLDGRGALKVTASLGVAALPDCASNKQELVAAADAALYEAKRGGKNRTERAPARSPKTVSAD